MSTIKHLDADGATLLPGLLLNKDEVEKEQ